MNLTSLEQYIFENKPFSLSEEQRKGIDNSYNFLKRFSKDKIIYGINTGFGPMAQYRISESDQSKLQYNLIRSHASGIGPKLPDLYVKAVMICRLNTLAVGKSGVSPAVAIQLEKFIQNNIFPIIPEHGSVGASGDLVQLAHLALALIGEGKGTFQGQEMPMSQILEKTGLEPVKLDLRDGLALINGTSCMSGIGIINLIKAKNLLNWATVLGATINEITESFDDSFSEELNRVKLHRGQNKIAEGMRACLSDSKRIRKREEHLFNTDNGTVEVFPTREKVQEYYSLRCIPQILGPVYDMLVNVEKTLVEEINSANDNPIIDIEKQNVYHGGNFHGDYISFEMDKLKIGITKLSMLCERQLNYLLNHNLNDRFAPFLNKGKLGFNFGMQGMQYTATSTTAESQALSNPMYVHSIPNNNDNQDIVSMGTNAALMAKTVINNTYQVMSVLAVAVAQAIDLSENESIFASKSKKVYKLVREHSAMITEDRFISEELGSIAQHLENEKSILQLPFN